MFLQKTLGRILSRVNIGTRSVLFGAHCFFLHPWFVAQAWRQLYGFPWDPRLWIAFFVHDLGYWGKPNMDGEEGELHPMWGAQVMGFLFDQDWYSWKWMTPVAKLLNMLFGPCPDFPTIPHIKGNFPDEAKAELLGLMTTLAGGELKPVNRTWYCFVFYHSRFLAKRYDTHYSKLCVADKLAIALTPGWLYLPMTRLTREIEEYMSQPKHIREVGEHLQDVVWYTSTQAHMRKWAMTHKDGIQDNWTPSSREPDENGVWK